MDRYDHDLVCNGSRNQPIGASGHGCSCLGRLQRDRVELRKLREENARLEDVILQRNAARDVGEIEATERLTAEIKTLTDRIEESRWIPVTERLPYEGESVLLTWGGHVLIGYHHERSDGFYSVFERVDDVTHWRPLPKPPEVG